MRKLLVVIICLSNIFCHAENIITTDEGKKLKIKNDGTWEEIKDNKKGKEILTTENGNKVILNDDGTWKEIKKEDRIKYFDQKRYDGYFYNSLFAGAFALFNYYQYGKYSQDADAATNKANEYYNTARTYFPYNIVQYNYYINEHNKKISESNTDNSNAKIYFIGTILGIIGTCYSYIMGGIENNKPRFPKQSSSLELYYAFTPHCGVLGIHKTF